MADADPMAAASTARVIFLGPPGAGKGTQAGLVARHFGVPKISTGDMLRDAIAQRTPLGLQAGPLMEQGRLVPDSLLIGIIEERLAQPDCGAGYVLDGFPRTLAQARGFETMAVSGLSGGLLVLNVEVPRDELLRRLSGRRWCPECQATYHVHNDPPKQNGICDRCGAALIQREDDKETAVERRLKEYDERTAPLIGYYRERSAFHTVDGHRAVDTVFSQLRGIVEGAR
ncbi:MAG: adenylate kinase [Actinomycetota bacterium]